MKIVLISPVLPFPPNDGDRVRVFSILKGLAGKNRITLVSFMRRGGEKNIRPLKKYCDKIRTVYISKAEIMINAFLSLFTGLPLNAGAYKSSRMKKEIEKTLKEENPGLVFVYRLRMAPYAEKTSRPKVIDIVDSLSLFMKRSSEYETSAFRKMYNAVDRPRVYAYERKMGRIFDAVFINSEEDAAFIGGKNITVAANGGYDVKTMPNVKRRMPNKKPATGNRQPAFVIGFFGNMDYRPNKEGIIYFYRKVWKKMCESDKSIKLAVVGDKSGAVKRAMRHPQAEIKGFAGDIEKEILKWDICVVPVRYGAGRQNKIMQAWACGVPVICSPFAAKGVYGKHGQNLLIAGSAKEFEKEINRLRTDKRLYAKLRANGLKTLKKSFSWKKTGIIIEKRIKKITGRR